MARYRLLILDVDDTLVDFSASQHAALEDLHRHAFAHIDLPRFRDTYTRINRALWAALDRGETTTEVIREQRFRQTAAALELPEPDWRALGAFYEHALAQRARLFPDTLETLARLAPRYRLATITNGLARVQRPKAARTGLDRWLDPYVISEEEGVAKPDPEVFRRCLERAGFRADEALMVGDSWDSDGAGAARAGMDFCWFRRDAKIAAPANQPAPVAIVASLPELAGWLERSA